MLIKYTFLPTTAMMCQYIFWINLCHTRSLKRSTIVWNSKQDTNMCSKFSIFQEWISKGKCFRILPSQLPLSDYARPAEPLPHSLILNENVKKEECGIFTNQLSAVRAYFCEAWRRRCSLVSSVVMCGDIFQCLGVAVKWFRMCDLCLWLCVHFALSFIWKWLFSAFC